MEYWHNLITEKSWKVLQELKGKFEFILIGGWAVYMLARAQKSKDIDVIAGISELQKINARYGLRKNDNLRKYEIKISEIDIDIYVPFYSKLVLPLEKIESQMIEGFKVIKPEELLILKQGAELGRKHSEKGEKDRIDIMSLLLSYEIDFKRYKKILKQNKLENLASELILLIKGFKEHEYFGLLPSKFKKRKKEILEKISKS
ncbi:hypothetical protein KY347_00010 [Candidatus Woesearchaeota archaeon]|nr:hypothetical protein [Candidatus Woesearchaeota archaeon]